MRRWISFLLIGSILVASLFFVFAVNPDQIAALVKRLGWWGPAVIVILGAVTHVVAPMDGMAIMMASIRLYGIGWSTLYMHTASMLSAVACFWVARKLGRVWIRKLVGTATLHRIDDFARTEADRLVILSRLFGFGIFEVVSYAMGLTKIPFRTYYLYTLIFSIPPSIATYLLYRQVDFSHPRGFILWGASLFVISSVFFVLLHRLYRRYQKKQSDKSLPTKTDESN